MLKGFVVTGGSDEIAPRAMMPIDRGRVSSGFA